ncbi:Na+/melibiose symporter-like transporter [Halopolyspora algeriensis]|uniref:Na+/melibiose symporter-like transporter n=1 Tax=Halopolyspora algeriensis TaxID=1500506 RepID=A0A368VVS3_9ACTN|nr:MFS transporter [Halopolyspora algeriensis]RCW46204.1 Na+/melibiose symporter-like transporter [Halopolyspora algeriensis]TQM55607.1 Na+/melibiose symporter-like transporter [Halopolyspora algeriensis]
MVDNDHGTRTSAFLAVLGLPAFGIALAYTLVTTYLPVLIERLSGPAITGAMVAGEGVLSLIVPTVVGSWSDATGTRIGGRMPFVLVGAVLAITGLVLIPVNAGSLLGIGIGLTVFFVGYFVYYSPYYALFPDLVPDAQRGRSQGAQGTFRSVGMLASLSVGGLLLHWWQPLPFLLGAVAIIGVTVVLYLSIRTRLQTTSPESTRNRTGRAREWELLRDQPDIRRWAVANSLWETAVGALRVFVVLYFTQGLGLSLPQVSGALALVGGAAIVAAPVSGKLADRYGHRPVMTAALWIFALGLLPPLLSTNTYFIAAIVPITFAAVVLITLPYSVLMGLLPDRQQHGIGAGLFGFSRGIGVLLGPLLAGLAVQLCRSVDVLVFAETDGYSAVFGVTSAALLASIPVLRRMPTHRDGA